MNAEELTAQRLAADCDRALGMITRENMKTEEKIKALEKEITELGLQEHSLYERVEFTKAQHDKALEAWCPVQAKLERAKKLIKLYREVEVEK